jgi:hypothetical protein
MNRNSIKSQKSKHLVGTSFEEGPLSSHCLNMNNFRYAEKFSLHPDIAVYE